MSTEEAGRKRAGIQGWFSELDSLLRGDLTRVSSLRSGGLLINPARLSVIIIALAMIYGVCMGSFAVFRPQGANPVQVLASMVKVPLLFYSDALGDFSFVIRVQRAGRIAAQAGDGRAACGGVAGGDGDGAVIAGPDRGFFFREYVELSVHAFIQRGGLYGRPGALGHGVSASDFASSECG